MAGKRKASPAQLANLKPFKKGEVHPKQHKPTKRMSMETCVALVLDRQVKGVKDKTMRMALAEKFVEDLLKSRDTKLLQMFMDREWPVTQFLQEQIEYTVNEGPFKEPFLSTEEANVNAGRDGRDRSDH